LVVRVVESFPPDGAFDVEDVARVVNQQYGASLRQRFDGRAVSVTLRRLVAAGDLHLVQKGTSHHLARYSRSRPTAPPSP
jgi:hypothetical protein